MNLKADLYRTSATMTDDSERPIGQSPSGIIKLFREAVKQVPLLKYGWVVIGTICVLALAGFFSLDPAAVFGWSLAMIGLSVLSFVFSYLLRTRDSFVKILLRLLIACIVIMVSTYILSLGSFLIWERPKLIGHIFQVVIPALDTTGVNTTSTGSTTYSPTAPIDTFAGKRVEGNDSTMATGEPAPWIDPMVGVNGDSISPPWTLSIVVEDPEGRELEGAEVNIRGMSKSTQRTNLSGQADFEIGTKKHKIEFKAHHLSFKASDWTKMTVLSDTLIRVTLRRQTGLIKDDTVELEALYRELIGKWDGIYRDPEGNAHGRRIYCLSLSVDGSTPLRATITNMQTGSITVFPCAVDKSHDIVLEKGEWKHIGQYSRQDRKIEITIYQNGVKKGEVQLLKQLRAC